MVVRMRTRSLEAACKGPAGEKESREWGTSVSMYSKAGWWERGGRDGRGLRVHCALSASALWPSEGVLGRSGVRCIF